MRVISGSAKGTRLVAPESGATRPTSDKVKEVIFSMIASLAPFDRILDLYAGSGALGIEAMSRWGGDVTFIETSAPALRALKLNLEATHLVENAHVQKRSVAQALLDLPGPFDLVVLDPPYADPGIVSTMDRLGCPGFVTPEGVVVLEHSGRFSAATVYGTLRLWKTRRHGDTALSLYCPSVSSTDAAVAEHQPEE